MAEGGRPAAGGGPAAAGGGGRLLIWSGLDAWRVEATSVELSVEGLHASGTQIGVDPLPYRLDYRLAAPERFVTSRLEVEALGSGWTRRLDLRREAGGGWTCKSGGEGRVDLPPAGGEVDGLREALDCDLGLSPLTNTLPVRRHRLDREPGAVDFLMAWVSVPDLGLHPSRQRYEHVRTDDDGVVVRYVDLGIHRGFEADLVLDRNGLATLYPGLAQRVGAPAPQIRDADEVA